MLYRQLMVLLRGPRRRPRGRPDGGQFAPGEGKPAKPSKAELAKQTSRYVGAEVQRYSEEHCEPVLAGKLGGASLRDNEPVDVQVTTAGGPHGIELKTMTDNKQNKVYMKANAMQRKRDWMRANRAHFHTVVFDDEAVFNARGRGRHDDTKRVIYYKRGVGSFRVSSMHRVKDFDELKRLLDTDTAKLPPGARPSTEYREPRRRAA